MVVVFAGGFLPTNYYSKPAFQEYAYNGMFQQASNLAISWNLDLPRPITTNMVTFFAARFYVGQGILGGLEFSNRFAFRWSWGKLDGFDDKPFLVMNATTSDVDANDALLEKWMRATNLLTMEKARVIAESAMRSAIVPEERHRFRKPDHMIQMTYEWKDGKEYPLPFYRFRWDGKRFGRYSGYDYEVIVSGITSNVTHGFFIYGSPYVKSIESTNYFELLGLPPNPVFVERLFLPTNQPAVYELYTNYFRSGFDRRRNR